MRRYSEEEKEEVLRKFEESGKTATEFGKESGIHRIILLKWVKAKRSKNNAANDAGEIVELNIGKILSRPKEHKNNSSIVLGMNGCVLQIGDEFNQVTLKNILDVVKQL